MLAVGRSSISVASVGSSSLRSRVAAPTPLALSGVPPSLLAAAAGLFSPPPHCQTSLSPRRDGAGGPVSFPRTPSSTSSSLYSSVSASRWSPGEDGAAPPGLRPRWQQASRIPRPPGSPGSPGGNSATAGGAPLPDSSPRMILEVAAAAVTPRMFSDRQPVAQIQAASAAVKPVSFAATLQGLPPRTGSPGMVPLPAVAFPMTPSPSKRPRGGTTASPPQPTRLSSSVPQTSIRAGPLPSLATAAAGRASPTCALPQGGSRGSSRGSRQSSGSRCSPSGGGMPPPSLLAIPVNIGRRGPPAVQLGVPSDLRRSVSAMSALYRHLPVGPNRHRLEEQYTVSSWYCTSL